ncbi:MAG: electron transfer flavoprotein subunit beta/FixA family protein [Lentisphaerae bacterium]|nr:electron transfer flavoprotein subunit beta/FixA family protein [Lentisphaerota bacterium]MBT4819438.1 electron transfer flavoprotein subunit beta/FixA family protein [Lentisphaerota bacterium]MBT5608430.1 electron transfer flavoprotein subunit beta/FixA family protein [Lentisphaerota bacterium]MBT7055048.1 electron transfer flavoprotein subunit beta/FixA family protein [Lentisphaerota bacterium]MBT7847768.1 electron transfer flavoprotein subunit beta/FixA family protein [Lentisphaerota bact
MSLKIFVCVKQVPDTKNITGQAMKEDGTVNRAALPAIFNPEDLNALEMALELRDEHGGKVIVCTMGPPAAADVLRHALYMGADETILVSDRAFAGADTLATSYTLACAVQKYGECDIVICGHQAIDGDTAQVGPQLAEKLDVPQITFVEGVLDVSEGRVRAKALIEGGYEVVESPTPVLMTVVGSANVPRPAGARRLMTYKKAVTRSELQAQHGGADYEDANQVAAEEDRLRERGLWIHEWHVEDIGADRERVGMPGSPTKVKKIESVVLSGQEFHDVPATQEGINELVHELISEHILS